MTELEALETEHQKLIGKLEVQLTAALKEIERLKHIIIAAKNELEDV